MTVSSAQLRTASHYQVSGTKAVTRPRVNPEICSPCADMCRSQRAASRNARRGYARLPGPTGHGHAAPCQACCKALGRSFTSRVGHLDLESMHLRCVAAMQKSQIQALEGAGAPLRARSLLPRLKVEARREGSLSRLGCTRTSKSRSRRG